MTKNAIVGLIVLSVLSSSGILDVWAGREILRGPTPPLVINPERTPPKAPSPPIALPPPSVKPPAGTIPEKGVLNPRTGEFTPEPSAGVVNPQTGEVLPKVEGGCVDSQNRRAPTRPEMALTTPNS